MGGAIPGRVSAELEANDRVVLPPVSRPPGQSSCGITAPSCATRNKPVHVGHTRIWLEAVPSLSSNLLQCGQRIGLMQLRPHTSVPTTRRDYVPSGSNVSVGLSLPTLADHVDARESDQLPHHIPKQPPCPPIFGFFSTGNPLFMGIGVEGRQAGRRLGKSSRTHAALARAKTKLDPIPRRRFA
jgi:hypothetical protein